MRYVVFLIGLLWVPALPAQSVDVREFFNRGGLSLAPGPVPAGPRLRTPFIEAYDLRTETNEFDYGRQEYTLRLNFSSPGRARAQRALLGQLLEQPLEALDEAACDRAEALYRDWVRLYLLDRELALADSLELVYADRQRVADRYAAALRADPDDALKLRTDRTELLLDRRARADRMTLMRTAYSLGEVPLDFTALPTVDEIETMLLTRTATSARQAPETAYDLALIDREMDLERAEGRQLLDFVQLRYRANVRDEFREKFSFGLAMRIPDSGDRRLKLRQLQLEKEIIEREGSLETQVRQIAGDIRAAALESAIGTYRATEAILQEENDALRSLAATVAVREGADPRFLLKVAAQRLTREQDRIDALRRVLDAYLDWREARAEFCVYPDGRLLRSIR